MGYFDLGQIIASLWVNCMETFIQLACINPLITTGDMETLLQAFASELLENLEEISPALHAQ